MKLTHLRCGRVVRCLATREDTVFKSKNKAKRYIREISHISTPGKATGYLHDAVRVVDKFPQQ